MPQTSLGELFTSVMNTVPSAETVAAKYTKPANGIPGTDLADGVIPDVQVNGTSVVSNGVANIPVATSEDYGVVKVNGSLGVGLTEDMLYVAGATNDMVKVGTQAYKPIVPSRQHMSVFYGLAKAAGFDEKYSELALGTYTADAKSAISDMLNAPEAVSGTAVSIIAKSGIRYECGEVVTLTITLPATGDCEFIFESGSTPTVLTITPPTGVTAVKWPEWFDPEDLEADTTYDIIITNGRYGVVTSWA